MFGDSQFEQLYKTLDAGMVDCDCGIRCGKFCCVGNDETEDPFKYLLPGEAEFLVLHNFHEHAILEDFGFVIRYRTQKPGACTCENIREYRPFCCRIFPFRPVIDEEKEIVTDLVKAKGERFSPCWIEEPLADWRKRAIEAWNFLLSDRSNLIFYAQFYLCLKKSETTSASFARALAEDEDFHRSIVGLDSLSNRDLLQHCRCFFDYV